MSERLLSCPECGSLDVDTKSVHDPDTRDMNSRATLKCCDCDHEWEGLVTSRWCEHQRAMGFIQ